jgi:hypothetical protein
MPRFVNRARLAQATLFHPPQPRPSLQKLPPENQEETIRLVAVLLRVHVRQVVAATNDAREARDE